jgi:hypothetical protein
MDSKVVKDEAARYFAEDTKRKKERIIDFLHTRILCPMSAPTAYSRDPTVAYITGPVC